ncbi:hypothetical protein [Streptomyces sp. MZ04]|uniref:hypothetical protein n=1 Tax=Streptomyces sp. MZ04 TaxID=2559236 RepID=UPI00107E770C|nr:hypothetical protein [Streptomyces sp. MZ04]TGA91891.1 hypothetical protein E2651_37505 [Streptomyces sp. MZ04]
MPSMTFPDDLVELQCAWTRTYDALATPRPRNTAALRRRLHRLSARLVSHPYWSAIPGGAPAARVELRRQARAVEEREVRAS